MDEIFLGRQPIFDRRRGVCGYELLFRDGEANSADIGPEDGVRATSQVLAHTMLHIGTARTTKGRPAFVNLGRGFLAEEHPLPLAPEDLVVEVLEDVLPEPAVMQSLNRYSRQGYRIALDDFEYRRELQPLLDVADIIKLDLRALERRSLERHVRLGRMAGKQLLAEKVETREELEHCRSLGFDYFQGYFLCPPRLVRGPGIRRLKSRQGPPGYPGARSRSRLPWGST
jgi:EAL and modified HD-GYP domain-containing signal transduction protein